MISAETEELRGGYAQALCHLHVQVEQSAQRQVHRGHLFEIDRIIETAESVEVGIVERQRCRRSQPRPLGAIEVVISVGRFRSHRSRG